MKKNNELNKIIIECKNSRSFRHALAYQSHEWFFRLYLNHHMEYPFSWFHKQMFGLSEEASIKLITVTAFRGAGKSTILNLSMILWSILGKPQKKFVVIISETKFQAKAQLRNIIEELKENELLKNDFGLIEEKNIGKNLTMVEIKKYNAKIITAINKQSLRGLRYKNRRPDLIICDDLESQFPNQTNKRKSKSRTEENGYLWFKENVLTCGDANTKIIVLGTPICSQSIIFRLMKDILERKVTGISKFYPLYNVGNNYLWIEKFGTKKEADAFTENLPKDTFYTEYQLMLRDGSMRDICNYNKINVATPINEDPKDYKSHKNLPISSLSSYIAEEIRKIENEKI